MFSLDSKLFLSTFALIFVAELPDKTMFATLLLATRKNPYAVFIGVGGAFVVQTIVAVVFGRVFALFPPSTVRIASGVLFLLFAVSMWLKKDENDEATPTQEQGVTFFKTVVSSFIVIFIAEWGDITQLATATLEAQYKNPFTILSSAILALWCATALAILVGNRAKNAINPAILQKVAAFAFALVGVVILLKA